MFIRVDVQVPKGLARQVRRHLILTCHGVERGQHNVFRVHLEEVPQGRPRIAASEPIGAQRHQFLTEPTSEHGGQGLHVIGGRHHDASIARQALVDIGHPRFVAGMQHVVPLRIDGVAM